MYFAAYFRDIKRTYFGRVGAPGFRKDIGFLAVAVTCLDVKSLPSLHVFSRHQQYPQSAHAVGAVRKR